MPGNKDSVGWVLQSRVSDWTTPMSTARNRHQFIDNISAEESKLKNHNFTCNSRHDNWWFRKPLSNVYISNTESLTLLVWTWKRQKGYAQPHRRKHVSAMTIALWKWASVDSWRTREVNEQERDLHTEMMLKRAEPGPWRQGTKKSHFIISPLPAFSCSQQ